MKTTSLLIVLVSIISICQPQKTEWYLIENYNQVSKHGAFGYTSGYVNQEGDTIIPLDKYAKCFTDTVRHYAIVYDTKKGLIGIDLEENILFNAVWDGEGYPIETSEGMLLIVENETYGFANNKGEIVIEPQYKCAESFINGKAKVSNDCYASNKGHNKWKMNTWTYIDKNGKEVK